MGAKAIVSSGMVLDAGKCLFCGKDQKQFKLRAFETLYSDKNVRQIATELGDTGLLAKIAVGDLILIGGKSLELSSSSSKPIQSFKKETE